MKRIILCCFLFLSGCATNYDSMEYEKYITIATLADEGSCDNENMLKLLRESRFLFRYSFHKPNEKEIIEASYELHQQIQALALRNQKGFSRAYCQQKLNQIGILAGQYAEIVGRTFR